MAIILPLLAQDPGDWRYPYQRGILQQKGEMYDYALENLGRALALKPDLYDAANRLGEIHMVKHNRRDALIMYLQSLSIKEDQAEIHCRAGELHDYFAEGEQAMIHFTRAVELDSRHVRAHLHLVRHYLAAGDTVRAHGHFDESRKLCMDAAGPSLEKAEKLEKAGRTGDAIQLYREILEKWPALPDVYLHIYEIHRARKEYPQAEKILKDLVYLLPDNDGAHARLGTLYLYAPLSGKRKVYLDLAEKHLLRAIELNPGDITSMESLVDLYRLKRDPDRQAAMEQRVRMLDSGGERVTPGDQGSGR